MLSKVGLGQLVSNGFFGGDLGGPVSGQAAAAAVLQNQYVEDNTLVIEAASSVPVPVL